MERASESSTARPDETDRQVFRDDPSEPLIDQHDEHDDSKPAIDVTFSTVKWLRLLVIPLAITDFALMVRWHRRRGGVPFTIITFLLLLWSIFHVLKTTRFFKRLPKGNGTSFEFTLGGLTISYGKPSGHSFMANKRKKSFLVNIVDFLACILMIVASVITLKKKLFGQYYNEEFFNNRVAGLSITLASLQLAISFLGLFSIFKGAKVQIYLVEEDEKAGYHQVQFPDHEDMERGQPAWTS